MVEHIAAAAPIAASSTPATTTTTTMTMAAATASASQPAPTPVAAPLHSPPRARVAPTAPSVATASVQAATTTAATCHVGNTIAAATGNVRIKMEATTPIDQIAPSQKRQKIEPTIASSVAVMPPASAATPHVALQHKQQQQPSLQQPMQQQTLQPTQGQAAAHATTIKLEPQEPPPSSSVGTALSGASPTSHQAVPAAHPPAAPTAIAPAAAIHTHTHTHTTMAKQEPQVHMPLVTATAATTTANAANVNVNINASVIANVNANASTTLTPAPAPAQPQAHLQAQPPMQQVTQSGSSVVTASPLSSSAESLPKPMHPRTTRSTQPQQPQQPVQQQPVQQQPVQQQPAQQQPVQQQPVQQQPVQQQPVQQPQRQLLQPIAPSPTAFQPPIATATTQTQIKTQMQMQTLPATMTTATTSTQMPMPMSATTNTAPAAVATTVTVTGSSIQPPTAPILSTSTATPTTAPTTAHPIPQTQTQPQPQIVTHATHATTITTATHATSTMATPIAPAPTQQLPAAHPTATAAAPVQQPDAPLKSTRMSHLRTKYIGELEYMLREFKKLERQLLGAKGGGQLEESAGSRERREKLHSFILHLQDTVRQIQAGCQAEAEGRSTTSATATAPGSAVPPAAAATTVTVPSHNQEQPASSDHAKVRLAQSSALANMTKEKEEEENVQKLEEHILANLLPVKVRLKKQLAAQQGATRNPVGMPLRRGSMQPSSVAQGKGTFAAAAEQRRKQAEAARLAALQRQEALTAGEQSPAVDDPTQFGQPLSGGGSSLTQKLHGATLGSKQRAYGHGVGSTKDMATSVPTVERKILYAGMVPGSTQHESSIAAASGAHELVIDDPETLSSPPPPAPVAGAIVAPAAPVALVQHQPHHPLQPQQQHQQAIPLATQQLPQHHAIAPTVPVGQPAATVAVHASLQPRTVQVAATTPHAAVAVVPPVAARPVMLAPSKPKAQATAVAIAPSRKPPPKLAVAPRTATVSVNAKALSGRPTSKDKRQPVDLSKMTEEEKRRYRKLRKKRKLLKLAKRREKERKRQLAMQQSNQTSSGSTKGGRKKSSGGKNQAKKKGPRTVEYLCGLCSEAYSSPCEFNPWWALAQHECPKCRKTQVPRLDISSPSNLIEYHPALLAHADDSNGGSGGNNSASVAAAVAANTHLAPVVAAPSAYSRGGSSKLNGADSDSDSDSDLSDLSDGDLSITSLDSVMSASDLQAMTPAEKAEYESFGLEYKGPVISDDEASRLLTLMGHASTCPCQHKSPKHRDVCRSTKYMMLHVRDCPGTTASFDVCPFPWCRKVKHLLFHLVSCVHPESCAICKPANPSPAMFNLMNLNVHRYEKRKLRMQAAMKAAATAAVIKPKPTSKSHTGGKKSGSKASQRSGSSRSKTSRTTKQAKASASARATVPRALPPAAIVARQPVRVIQQAPRRATAKMHVQARTHVPIAPSTAAHKPAPVVSTRVAVQPAPMHVTTVQRKMVVAQSPRVVPLQQKAATQTLPPKLSVPNPMAASTVMQHSPHVAAVARAPVPLPAAATTTIAPSLPAQPPSRVEQSIKPMVTQAVGQHATQLAVDNVVQQPQPQHQHQLQAQQHQQMAMPNGAVHVGTAIGKPTIRSQPTSVPIAQRTHVGQITQPMVVPNQSLQPRVAIASKPLQAPPAPAAPTPVAGVSYAPSPAMAISAPVAVANPAQTYRAKPVATMAAPAASHPNAVSYAKPISAATVQPPIQGSVQVLTQPKAQPHVQAYIQAQAQRPATMPVAVKTEVAQQQRQAAGTVTMHTRLTSPTLLQNIKLEPHDGVHPTTTTAAVAAPAAPPRAGPALAKQEDATPVTRVPQPAGVPIMNQAPPAQQKAIVPAGGAPNVMAANPTATTTSTISHPPVAVTAPPAPVAAATAPAPTNPNANTGPPTVASGNDIVEQTVKVA